METAFSMETKFNFRALQTTICWKSKKSMCCSEMKYRHIKVQRSVFSVFIIIIVIIIIVINIIIIIITIIIITIIIIVIIIIIIIIIIIQSKTTFAFWYACIPFPGNTSTYYN